MIKKRRRKKERGNVYWNSKTVIHNKSLLLRLKQINYHYCFANITPTITCSCSCWALYQLINSYSIYHLPFDINWLLIRVYCRLWLSWFFFVWLRIQCVTRLNNPLVLYNLVRVTSAHALIKYQFNFLHRNKDTFSLTHDAFNNQCKKEKDTCSNHNLVYPVSIFI